MNIQPFYIIPTLIKQPTWGGSYIVAAKQLLHPELENHKIGQSYELSAESRVSLDPAAQDCFLLTDAALGDAQQFGPNVESYDLQSLIQLNPAAMMGEAWVSEGVTMPLLVKFNQAKNNSYQVHIRPGSEFHGWQAKPETWYYLESGKATVGLKPDVDLAQYKRTCSEIDAFARELSTQVKNELLDVAAARAQLRSYVEDRHPRQFVNTIELPRGSVVNLWQGGIHHSWEADETLPEGNIVFEVQLSAKDERSTLRSFDQASMKDNGDVRPLHVEDYFQALNTSPDANHPDRHVTQPQGHDEGSVSLTLLCQTPWYQMQRIAFTDAGAVTRQTESFHHVYAHKGEVRVEWHDLVFDLKSGRSLFIPAACGTYLLSSSDGATVLETTLAAPE